MKNTLFFFLLNLFISHTTFADSIKCYSGNKIIYHHNIKDVTFTGDMFVFVEKDTENMMMYSGDCIVTVDF